MEINKNNDKGITEIESENKGKKQSRRLAASSQLSS
jgi:hypothetical protein